MKCHSFMRNYEVVNCDIFQFISEPNIASPVETDTFVRRVYSAASLLLVDTQDIFDHMFLN